MRARKYRPEVDLRARVAATKDRIARERLGIPSLEAELERMRFANQSARRIGEPDVFSESEGTELTTRIQELVAQIRY